MNRVKYIQDKLFNVDAVLNDQKWNCSRLLTITIFCLFAITIALRIVLLKSYLPDLTVGEDNNVWNIQQVLLGKSIYTDPSKLPFEIFQYTPLFQLPVIFLAKVFSFVPGEDVYSFFVLSRSLSLLYNLGSALTVFLLLRKRFNVALNLALFASFFSLALISRDCFTLRPNALFQLFFLLAIYWIILSLQTRKFRDQLVAALFISLCIFTKQSGIQLIITLGGFLLLFEKFTFSIKFFGTVIGAFIIFALGFWGIFGDVFFANTIGGISLPMNYLVAYQVFDFVFFRNSVLFISAVLIALYWVIRQNKSDFSAVGIFTLGTLIFAMGTSLKVGSGIGYYDETIIMCLITVAIGSHHFMNRHASISRNKGSMVAIAFLALYFPMLLSNQFFHQYSRNISSAHEVKYHEDKIIAAQLKKNLAPDAKLFTPHKNIKNFLIEESILPNTEFYGVSKIDFSESKKLSEEGKIEVLLSKDPMDYRTLKRTGIDIKKYTPIMTFGDLTLYRNYVGKK